MTVEQGRGGLSMGGPHQPQQWHRSRWWAWVPGKMAVGRQWPSTAILACGFFVF